MVREEKEERVRGREHDGNRVEEGEENEAQRED